MIKMWTPKVFYAHTAGGIDLIPIAVEDVAETETVPFNPGPTVAGALRKKYSVEKGYTIKEVLVNSEQFGDGRAYYRTIGEVLNPPAASDSSDNPR